jgi:hypothetical protein
MLKNVSVERLYRFLCHRVDYSGVQPLPSYVEAIMNFRLSQMSGSCRGSGAFLAFIKKILDNIANTLGLIMLVAKV